MGAKAPQWHAVVAQRRYHRHRASNHAGADMVAVSRSTLALAFIVSVLVVSVEAQGAPPSSADENWARQPTAAESSAADAQFKIPPDIIGGAAMRCAVNDDGSLTECQVILENPIGTGMGAALLSLAPAYRRKPPGKLDLRNVNVVEYRYPVDTHPDWVRRPRPEDIRAVWPSEAMKRGVGGRAVINCLVTAQGALTQCLAIEEWPASEGFGGAAIALSPQLTFKPAKLNGVAVPSPVTIPFNFGAGVGTGPIPGDKKVLPVNMAWAEAPSYADVAAAYPKKASIEKRGGRATLACDMTQEGRLASCDSLASEPRGYGFDTAAKALARQFRLQLLTPEDKTTARKIVVHIPFTFDPAMLTQSTPIIGKPSWASLPSGPEAQAAFQSLKQPGTIRAMLSCTVQPAGALGGCKVESETPAGSGAGAAGLTLAPRFKVSTWTTEGLPTIGGTIRVPLRYDGDPPAPK